MCCAAQNLREAIASYRLRFLNERTERKRNALLDVCMQYLERYYMLIAFTSYLAHPDFDPSAPSFEPFPSFTSARPELQSILKRMLRRNGMLALELVEPKHPVKPARPPATAAAVEALPPAGMLYTGAHTRAHRHTHTHTQTHTQSINQGWAVDIHPKRLLTRSSGLRYLICVLSHPSAAPNESQLLRLPSSC